MLAAEWCTGCSRWGRSATEAHPFSKAENHRWMDHTGNAFVPRTCLILLTVSPFESPHLGQNFISGYWSFLAFVISAASKCASLKNAHLTGRLRWKVLISFFGKPMHEQSCERHTREAAEMRSKMLFKTLQNTFVQNSVNKLCSVDWFVLVGIHCCFLDRLVGIFLKPRETVQNLPSLPSLQPTGQKRRKTAQNLPSVAFSSNN